MKRTLLMVVGGAALVLATVTGAFADGGALTDPIGDTKGKKPPGGKKEADVDFAGGSFGHIKPGKVFHRVRIVGDDVDNPDKPGADNLFLPVLRINLPKGGPGCELVVTQRQPEGDRVYTCNPDGTPGTPVAKAAVTKVNDHVLKYVFKKRAIGNPRQYGFAFAFFDYADGIAYDRLPDDGYVKHRLRG